MLTGMADFEERGPRVLTPLRPLQGFKLPWREAGPPNHHDDKVDSDQYVVNKELSLAGTADFEDRAPRVRTPLRPLPSRLSTPRSDRSWFHRSGFVLGIQMTVA